MKPNDKLSELGELQKSIGTFLRQVSRGSEMLETIPLVGSESKLDNIKDLKEMETNISKNTITFDNGLSVPVYLSEIFSLIDGKNVRKAINQYEAYIRKFHEKKSENFQIIFENLTEIMLEKGLDLMKENKIAGALLILKKIEEISNSRSFGDYPEIRALLFNYKGCFYKESNTMNLAITNFLKALKIIKTIGVKRNHAWMYKNISTVLFQLGYKKSAKEYARQAIRSAEAQLMDFHSIPHSGINIDNEEEDSIASYYINTCAVAYQNLGTQYESEKNRSKAFKYYQKAVSIVEKGLGDDNPIYAKFHDHFQKYSLQNHSNMMRESFKSVNRNNRIEMEKGRSIGSMSEINNGVPLLRSEYLNSEKITYSSQSQMKRLQSPDGPSLMKNDSFKDSTVKLKRPQLNRVYSDIKSDKNQEAYDQMNQEEEVYKPRIKFNDDIAEKMKETAENLDNFEEYENSDEEMALTLKSKTVFKLRMTEMRMNQTKLKDGRADRIKKKNTEDFNTIQMKEQLISPQDRLKDYDKIILRKIKNNKNGEQVNFNFLRCFDIEKYNEATFIILESNYYQNSFTNAYNGFHKKKRQTILIKEALLFYENNNDDKLAQKVASVLREKEILSYLSKTKRKYFSECEGCFYKENEEPITDLSSVLVITSTGDASLGQLLEKFSTGIISKTYTEKELFSLLQHFIRGFKIMQENRIYHSNINLKKFALDFKENTYFLTDFSVAKLIPEGMNIVEIKEYGQSGTKGQMSPEREFYFKNCNSIEWLEKGEYQHFNPFKDDIWSLGECLRKLFKASKISKNCQLDKFLTEMVNIDWQKRPDAMELDYRINKNYNQELSLPEIDRNFKKLIISDRVLAQRDPKEVYKKLDEAQLMEEQKEFLHIHLESQNESGLRGWLHLQNGILLNRLGEKEEALENLKQSLSFYESEGELLKIKLEVKEENVFFVELFQVHLAHFQIYKDFGDFSKASEAIEKAQKLLADNKVDNLDHLKAVLLREQVKLYNILGLRELIEQKYSLMDAFIEGGLDRIPPGDFLEFCRTGIEISYIKGDPDELKGYRKLIFALFKTNLHLDIAKARYYTAILLSRNEENYEESLTQFRKTIYIYSKILKSDHPDFKNAENWRNYIESLMKTGTAARLKPLLYYPDQDLRKSGGHYLKPAEEKVEINDEIINDPRNVFILNELTIQILEKSEFLDEIKNIKIFNKHKYKNLDRLGKGAFGEVWRAIDVETRKMTALKFFYVNLDSENKLAEKDSTGLAGLVREKTILQIFKNKKNDVNNDCFCEIVDMCYKKGSEYSEKKAAYVLITTAGDCDLRELREMRKKTKGTDSPYTSEEVTLIIKDLSEALMNLQSLGIYHSDIKPENIVYNSAKNKYQLIDFGVSRLVITTDNKINENFSLKDYGNGGTLRYISPEKREYWEEYDNLCKQGITESAQLKALDSFMFNPFKCDMYSLGVSMTTLLSEDELSKCEFIPLMKEKNIEKRISAGELNSKLTSYIQNSARKLKKSHIESEYLALIKKEKWEKGFTHFYEMYEEAFLPEEQLELVEHELKIAESSQKISSSSNLKLMEIKFRKGLTLKSLGKLKKAEDQFFEVLRDLELIRDSKTNEINSEAFLKIIVNNKMELASNSLLELASIRSIRGQYEKTKAFLEKALVLREVFHKYVDHIEVLKVKQKLVIQKGIIGDYGGASEELEIIKNIFIKKFSSPIEDSEKKSTYLAISNIMLDQAKLWSCLGQNKRAISQMNQVLEMRLNFFKTEKHPDIAEVMQEIVKENIKMRTTTDLDNSIDKVLKIRRSLYKSDYHPAVLETIFTKAQNIFFKKRYREACAVFRNVLEKYKEISNIENNPKVYSTEKWIDLCRSAESLSNTICLSKSENIDVNKVISPVKSPVHRGKSKFQFYE